MREDGPMRSGLVRSVAVFAMVLALPAFAQDGGNIALGVGTQKVLTVPGIQRVAVGDADVADVKTIGNNQLLIIGSDEGKTTLLVWKTSGQRVSYLVSVRKQDPNEIISEIKKLLGEIEGVNVRMVGDRIYLDGQAYTQADADRIDQVVGLYGNVKSFVKIAPNAKKLVAQNLNAAFQKAGLKNVQANVVGSTIFLEGSVESQQDLQKAELITKAIGEKVENLLVVGIKRMILTEVQFVEIRRAGHRSLRHPLPHRHLGHRAGHGEHHQGALPRQLRGRRDCCANGTGSSQFNVGFQMNDGYGRLLAQPKLVCASGEKAEFLAGGEVPIPLITNNQFTVEYKPYGVILKLRPTADRNGNIQTEIEAEVSEVDVVGRRRRRRRRRPCPASAPAR